MKQLIRRLSRVSDSSQCRPLLRVAKNRGSSSSGYPTACRGQGEVPEGHVPVYVGEEMERFVVRADLLSRPMFVELLRRSAQEYGYQQRGVLRIPCPVRLFERVLQAICDGGVVEDDYAEELAQCFPEDLAICS